MEKSFKGIWYRERPKEGFSISSISERVTGKLNFMDKKIQFSGRNRNIEITNIQSLTFRFFGSDFINPGIKVVYKDKEKLTETYFIDGKILGYYGLLGGTKYIFSYFRRFAPNAKVKTDKWYILRVIVFLYILSMIAFRLIL